MSQEQAEVYHLILNENENVTPLTTTDCSLIMFKNSMPENFVSDAISQCAYIN